TSAIKTGMKYFAASMVIAAAAAVYGLFSHGVYSYYMTYAFMIPLLAGALPYLLTAMKEAGQTAEKAENAAGGCEDHEAAAELAGKEKKPSGFANILDANEARLAFVTTLTAGSLLKGALDIYGTTNRLLIVYPIIALLILLLFAVQSAQRLKSQRRCDADQYASSDAAE
ncbi:MAG: hypothetical protein IKE74_03875, partial [Mogibacterium sp.]|nr:hypothetical protein [Mogibacterium sp.]